MYLVTVNMLSLTHVQGMGWLVNWICAHEFCFLSSFVNYIHAESFGSSTAKVLKHPNSHDPLSSSLKTGNPTKVQPTPSQMLIHSLYICRDFHDSMVFTTFFVAIISRHCSLKSIRLVPSPLSPATPLPLNQTPPQGR